MKQSQSGESEILNINLVNNFSFFVDRSAKFIDLFFLFSNLIVTLLFACQTINHHIYDKAPTFEYSQAMLYKLLHSKWYMFYFNIIEGTYQQLVQKISSKSKYNFYEVFCTLQNSLVAGQTYTREHFIITKYKNIIS